MANNETDFQKENEKQSESCSNDNMQCIAAATWASKTLDTFSNQSSKGSSSLPDLSITNLTKEKNSISGSLQNDSGSAITNLKELFSAVKSGDIGNIKLGKELSSSHMVEKLQDFLNSPNGIEWKQRIEKGKENNQQGRLSQQELDRAQDGSQQKRQNNRDGRNENNNSRDGRNENNNSRDGRNENNNSRDGRNENNNSRDGRNENNNSRDGRNENNNGRDGRNENNNSRDGRNDNHNSRDGRNDNQQQQDFRQRQGSDRDRTQDGQRADEGADRNRVKPGDGRDRTERPQERLNEREQRLYDRMRERGATPDDLRKFHEDLVKLRSRGLSEQEVSRTLDQVERLMESQGDRPVSQNERRNIAMQIVHHAANPTEIDQGNHNTCNVTTAEERMFTRTPAKAAEMIVTAATTGAWTAPDGRRIAVDAGSLVPGAEERPSFPADGQRSHASQIFQVVAANDITQRRDPPQFYRQETPTGANDTGERLVYADGRPVMETVDGRQQRVNHPKISVDDLAAQGRRLTGDTGYVLLHSDFAAGEGVRSIGSQQQLVTAVQELARRGQLPATVYVDASHASFLADGSPAHQAHVVSITGYDAATGTFRISNQWGSGSDINISGANLFAAMANRPAPPAPPPRRR